MSVRYARVSGGKVVEIFINNTGFGIAQLFHADINWITCDPGVTEGWLYKNGVFSPSAQEAVLPTLSDAKTAKQAEIRDTADAFLAALALEYGAYEKLTWDQQAMEADALTADANASAPLVRSIAAARGMSVLELAARIRANRAQWIVLSGYIVGQRLKYQDQLDAATTTEQVAAIVPTYSLP